MHREVVSGHREVVSGLAHDNGTGESIMCRPKPCGTSQWAALRYPVFMCPARPQALPGGPCGTSQWPGRHLPVGCASLPGVYVPCEAAGHFPVFCCAARGRAALPSGPEGTSQWAGGHFPEGGIIKRGCAAGRILFGLGLWRSKVLVIEAEGYGEVVGYFYCLSVVTSGIPFGHRAHYSERFFVEGRVTSAHYACVFDGACT